MNYNLTIPLWAESIKLLSAHFLTGRTKNTAPSTDHHSLEAFAAERTKGAFLAVNLQKGCIAVILSLGGKVFLRRYFIFSDKER